MTNDRAEILMGLEKSGRTVFVGDGEGYWFGLTRDNR